MLEMVNIIPAKIQHDSIVISAASMAVEPSLAIMAYVQFIMHSFPFP